MTVSATWIRWASARGVRAGGGTPSRAASSTAGSSDAGPARSGPGLALAPYIGARLGGLAAEGAAGGDRGEGGHGDDGPAE